MFLISTKREKLLHGIKLGIPITFGYIPMGIGYAALAIKAGLDPVHTVLMSFFVDNLTLIFLGANFFNSLWILSFIPFILIFPPLNKI